MKKIAFVFPGQGAQYVGMGKEFHDNFKESRDIFSKANEALGFDITKMCFEGSQEELSVTEITQPAILTTSMAIYEVLKRYNIEPCAFGGLSLGEYSVHVAADSVDFRSAVKLVNKRGRYMQNEVPVGEGGMLALMGCSDDEAIKFCEYVTENKATLEPANFNCPGQIVVGGKADAIEFALKEAQNRGIRRATKLQVSAPFHTSMLRGAGDKLMEDLKQVEFKEMSHPVIANYDGMYYENKSDIPGKLKNQVFNSVKWQTCIEKMIDDGIDTFVEVGPGRSLCGFIKKINKSAKSYNIENIETLNSFLADM